MGYGQIVSGMTSAARKKERGGSSRAISRYRGQRDRIAAKAQTIEATGQAAVSLYKGWSEGQSQWKNVEAGAEEMGLGDQFKQKRADASWWERQTGPSEKTLDSMVSGMSGDERLDISMGELKTMGRIKREAGSRFIKTLDPSTGKYKDVKDSGWGEKTKLEPGAGGAIAGGGGPGAGDLFDVPNFGAGEGEDDSLMDNIGQSISGFWDKRKKGYQSAVDRQEKSFYKQFPQYQPKPEEEAPSYLQIQKEEKALLDNQNQQVVPQDVTSASLRRREDVYNKARETQGLEPKELGNENEKYTQSYIEENQKVLDALGAGNNTESVVPEAGISFNQAFGQAREQGLGEFEYEGNRYNTNLKEEPEGLGD